MTDPRFSRTDPRAGFTDGKRLPACRECAGPLPPRKRSFCGPACIERWSIRASSAYAASKVLERDHGVCQQCKVDCVALLRELNELLRQQRHQERSNAYPHEPPYSFELEGDGVFAATVRELGLKGDRALLRRRLWEADHVVPVVEGGGSCGLEGLRTLCWRCHQHATAELARRRAERRKAVSDQNRKPKETTCSE